MKLPARCRLLQPSVASRIYTFAVISSRYILSLQISMWNIQTIKNSLHLNKFTIAIQLSVNCATNNVFIIQNRKLTLKYDKLQSIWHAQGWAMLKAVGVRCPSTHYITFCSIIFFLLMFPTSAVWGAFSITQS